MSLAPRGRGQGEGAKNASVIQLATEFFRETLERLHVDPSRFFVIPGNHDVDRTVNRADWSGLRKKLRLEDGLDLARWLSGGSAPRGFRNSVRERLLDRQAEFRRWLGDDWPRQDLLPQNSPHGRLGYRCTVDLPGRPFPVHVIGLDTAWLCGDDHDAGKLCLTTETASTSITAFRVRIGMKLPLFRASQRLSSASLLSFPVLRLESQAVGVFADLSLDPIRHSGREVGVALILQPIPRSFQLADDGCHRACSNMVRIYVS